MVMLRFLLAKQQPAAAANIFCFGGENSSISYLSTVEKYSIKNDTISSASSLATAITGMASAGDSIYALNTAGYTGNNQTTCKKYVFSSETESSAASCSTGRRGHQAFCNGTLVYVAGGFGTTNSISSVEKYSMSGNSWSSGTSLLYLRTGPTSFGNTTIFWTTGGINFSPLTRYAYTDKYTISTDAVSSATNLSDSSSGHGRGSNTSKGVMCGGETSSGNITACDEYTLSSDSVSSGSSLSTGKRNISGGSDSTKAYMPGGYTTTYVATSDIYNMSTSSRTSATGLSAARQVTPAVASSAPGHI